MKWYGIVGYGETYESSPGVWSEKITEHNYYGEVTRNTRILQSASQVNDNINVSNTISIVADPYATQNFHSIRYVTFMGSKWKVTNVDVQYPRLNMTIGGLYNAN